MLSLGSAGRSRRRPLFEGRRAELRPPPSMPSPMPWATCRSTRTPGEGKLLARHEHGIDEMTSSMSPWTAGYAAWVSACRGEASRCARSAPNCRGRGRHQVSRVKPNARAPSSSPWLKPDGARAQRPGLGLELGIEEDHRARAACFTPRAARRTRGRSFEPLQTIGDMAQGFSRVQAGGGRVRREARTSRPRAIRCVHGRMAVQEHDGLLARTAAGGRRGWIDGAPSSRSLRASAEALR